MKKLSKYIFTIFIIILSVVKVSALSVTENSLTMTKGTNKDITLYANSETLINKVEFTLVFISNDVPANFKVNSLYTDSTPNSTKHTINFNEAKSGKIELGAVNIRIVDSPNDKTGTINIHSAKGYTESGEVVNLNSQIINITINKDEITNNNEGTTGEKPKEEEVKQEQPKKEEIQVNEEEDKSNQEKIEQNKNLLKLIDSKIVNIKLKEDVYEYRITISEDIKELDLKPIVKDEKYKVEISTQKINEIKDNKIVIKVSDNDYQEEYTIKIKVKENIEIDNSEFKANNSYKSKWIVIIVIFSVMLLSSLIFTKKK